MTRFVALLVLSLALLAPNAFAQDAKKEQLARELMALTGSGDLGKQMMEQMAATMRNQPGLPPGFLDKFLELAKPDDLVNMIVPLYVEAYDEKTLTAAVKFYKTAEGKKLVGALPMITQQSM
jgi:hypothetical protein